MDHQFGPQGGAPAPSKPVQHGRPIGPRDLLACQVPGLGLPGILGKVPEIGDAPRPQGSEVDGPGQLPQVGLFLLDTDVRR